MNAWTKLNLLQRILRWRLTWDKRDTHFRHAVDGNSRFMGPREAVGLIEDGDFVAVSGLGGNQHATILYWALRELFQETASPRNLTLMPIGGQGGRGKVPGTVDELALDGLCTRFITGHLETFKGMLRLADEGKLELQCYPQGTLALLLDAQARGEESVVVPTGVGTMLDPEMGRGTPLCPPDAEQFATREGDRIRYRLPLIDVALINAPAADAQGNVYMKHTAMIAEAREIAVAARRNGGRVLVTVGKLVEKGYDEPFFGPDEVDAIVYYPKTGQTLSRSHATPWSLLTLESDVALDEGYQQMRFINKVIGVTPRRTPIEMAMGRLAASVFAEHAPKGALVNIGTGLPEEVCREIYEGGLIDDLTFFTESGVVGGLPGPGVFFGAAACPESMVSSADIFKRAHRELDVTILGILEVDGAGNVNVSKRGEGMINYVGPGGFIDFSTSAGLVLFIGSWMAHSKVAIEGSRVKILEHGTPKFVEEIAEVTFSGAEALKAGRTVFYVTSVGVFQLVPDGLILVRVMPGIDIERDILALSPTAILVPDGEVALVSESIVTGEGFALELAAR